jgi:hypothetical protein
LSQITETDWHQYLKTAKIRDAKTGSVSVGGLRTARETSDLKTSGLEVFMEVLDTYVGRYKAGTHAQTYQVTRQGNYLELSQSFDSGRKLDKLVTLVAEHFGSETNKSSLKFIFEKDGIVGLEYLWGQTVNKAHRVE